jgi:hypothetical protein
MVALEEGEDISLRSSMLLRWQALQGLFSGRWYFKMFNLILGLASFATACMGMWAAGETIQAMFAISGAATSFGCIAPVWCAQSFALLMRWSMNVIYVL